MITLDTRTLRLVLLSTLTACVEPPAHEASDDSSAGQTTPTTSEDLAQLGTRSRPAGSIVVMTRNQYLGADVTKVVAATDAASFNQAAIAALTQIAANDFPERVLSLALEIALVRPDVIGLQEVFSLELNGAHGAPPFRDQLADTLTALALFGQRYVVAAQVQNLSIDLPIDVDANGSVDATVHALDRDVILVRQGLAATPVPFSATCSRPSLDGGPGCNFGVVVTAPTPVGDLLIQRGYVGVDVTVNHRAYRVVSTHVEVPDLDPTNPLSPLIQALQTQELTATLATTPTDRTLLAIGDFNSGPDERTIMVGPFTIVPPYLQLATASFTDAWLIDPRIRPGFTCCQAEDLRNDPSALIERIDLILSRERPLAARAELVGSRPFERTILQRLWPSDHAGVVAWLQF